MSWISHLNLLMAKSSSSSLWLPSYHVEKPKEFKTVWIIQKKWIKKEDACFKVMWDIILQQLIQNCFFAVSHLRGIFFYCRSNEHSLFLCNLIWVITYKFLEECGRVAFWGQWQQKPGTFQLAWSGNGFSPWAEGIVYPQPWLCSCLGGVEEGKGCNQSTFCGAQILGCNCCFSSVRPNQHQVLIALLSAAAAAEDAAASLGTYRGRLNIAPRPNEFFGVWCFVLDQRLYHSWEMRANTFATDVMKPICQCQRVFSSVTWRQ